MKVQINIRMEDDLKKRLEELAEADGRSLNNLFNKMANDYVASKKNLRVWKKEKHTNGMKIMLVDTEESR